MSKATTKIAIAYAFKELLLEKPFHKITVGNIAEKCDIATLTDRPFIIIFMILWSWRNGPARWMPRER